MKQSNVNLENLLNQLSEERINLVVDGNLVRAAGTKSCKSHKSSKSCKSSKSNKSCKTH